MAVVGFISGGKQTSSYIISQCMKFPFCLISRFSPDQQALEIRMTIINQRVWEALSARWGTKCQSLFNCYPRA